MNGCGIQSRDMAVLLWGYSSNGEVRLAIGELITISKTKTKIHIMSCLTMIFQSIYFDVTKYKTFQQYSAYKK